MQVQVGARLRSAVCDTEVIVVRAPSEDVALCCGGTEMIPHDAARPVETSPAPGEDTGTQLGKRYRAEGLGLELLCTKAGSGTLRAAGQPLEIAQAKSLPSSD